MALLDNCELILSHFNQYSTEMMSLGESIEDQRMEGFEKKILYILPEDYKYMLKKHNGFSLDGTEVYGLDQKFRGSSLDSVYQFEHYEVANSMPNFFLPFSPDGRGNHYCFDLRHLKDGVCPVVFWQWDYDYKNFEEIEVCNDSFLDWVQEVMIDWMSEK